MYCVAASEIGSHRYWRQFVMTSTSCVHTRNVDVTSPCDLRWSSSATDRPSQVGCQTGSASSRPDPQIRIVE